MGATERARRSDALYYSSESRRTLCDMVARLEERARAKAVFGEDPDAAFLSDSWGASCRCGNCGRPLGLSDSFCAGCGAEVEWGDE